MYRQERVTLSRLIFGCGATYQEDWRDWMDAAYMAVCFTQRTQTGRVADDIAAWADGDHRQIKMQRRLALLAIRSGVTRDIYDRARAAIAVDDTIGALVALCELPGLNCPKAGFLLQIAWGVGGCIDTRNVKEFGVQPPEVRKSWPAQRIRETCAEYLALCTKLGGSEFLWDNWCRGAAASFKKWNKSADNAPAVSREHIDWIIDCHAVLFGR